MGLHRLPHTELLWSSDPLFRIQTIANIMVIKRSKKIRQALHLNDTSQVPSPENFNSNKLIKLRPLIDKLNSAFSQQYQQSSDKLHITAQAVKLAWHLFRESHLKSEPNPA